MSLKISFITVGGYEYNVLSLMAAADYKEQQKNFMEIFKSAPQETKDKWENSEAFSDPTLNCSQEELEDSNDNYVLFPMDFTDMLNANPESNVDNEIVYLLKPSGVFKLTYKQSLELKFPRNTSNLEKTNLNPKDFIDALKECPTLIN